MRNLLLFIMAVVTGYCVDAQIVPNLPSPSSVAAPTITYPYLSNYGNLTLRNYIRIFTPQQKTTNVGAISLGAPTGDPLVITAYKDGLDRPLQTVLKSPIPNNLGDLVKVYVYDEQGREPNQYLPYVSDAAVPGKLKVNPFWDLPAFYGNIYPNDQPYSETVFDRSPLNRASKVMPPGNSWVGSGVGKQQEYLANKNITSYITGTSVYDFNVLKYTIDHNDINDLPVAGGYYAEGDLMVEKNTDEDQNITLTYRDMTGREVATMQYMQSPQNSTDKYFQVTYYVYDDFDQLRVVISPKAFASTGNTGNITQQIADGLCFRYWYNAKGLLTQKKQPGVLPEYFVYDKRDRQVLRQDGALRNDAQKWFFTTYDVLDRTMMTGVAVSGLTQAQWESFFATDVYTNHTTQELKYFLLKYDLYNEYENNFLFDADIYTKNYYDDYKNIDYITPAGFGCCALNNDLLPTSSYIPTASLSQQTRGLLVGTRVRKMNTTNSIDWYKTYNYYDQEARLIQQNRTPAHGTGTDITRLQYDFSGTLVRSIEFHSDKDSTNTTYATTIIINHIKDYGSGQVTGIEQSINGSAFIPVSKDFYDGLGRVGNHELAGALNNLDYNIRGWLTGINAANMDAGGTSNEYFREQISYDKGFADVHLNGNISGIVWKGYGTGAKKRCYGYTYDNANRLVHAEFAEMTPALQDPNTPWIVYPDILDKTQKDFTVSNLNYDHNGNLLSMNQRGPNSAATPMSGDIDILKYNYNQYSNQLQSIQDSGIVSPSVTDFTDGNTTIADYEYDGNGSLTKDLNKNISSIANWSTYNKPLHIVVNGKGTIDYLYDGEGNKIRKTVIDNTGSGADTTITDYNGPFVYENNKLKHILHEEGRCRPINAAGPPNEYTYDYFIKDHIGNVRSVYNLTSLSLGTHLYGTGLELAMAGTESFIWANLNDVRANKPLGITGDVQAAELNAAEGKTIGPAISMKVMPGDKFTLSAETFYDVTGNDSENDPQNLMDQLFGALVGGTTMNGNPVTESAGNIEQLSNTLSNPNIATLFQNLRSGVQVEDGAPASYLTYLFFDSRNQLDLSHSGIIPFGNGGDAWQSIASPGIVEIPEAGTLTVFAYSDALYPTFIDNVNLTYYNGNIIEEEDHYYPFGLSISHQAVDPGKRNNFKYTGQELQHAEFSDGSGLEMYDYIARGMDPQSGRFLQLDPLAEEAVNWTPYRYAFDNPVYFNDPTGMREGHGENVTITAGRLTSGSGPQEDDMPYLFPYLFQPDATARLMPNLASKIIIPPPVPIPSINQSANSSQNTNWMQMISQSNWTFGIAATSMDVKGGFNIMEMYNRGIRAGVYGNYQLTGRNLNLFRNARMTSFSQPISKIGRIGKVAGAASFFVGVSADAVGVYIYSKNPKSNNAVHPVKMGVNTVFGVIGLGIAKYGIEANPVTAIGYFGLEAFYPGGAMGFMTNTSEMVDLNRQVVPNYRITMPGD